MGYVFNGPIRIHFDRNAELPTGRFTVDLRGGRRPDRAAAQHDLVATGRTALVLEVNGLRHPLKPPGFLIGRGTDADLRINDPGISRLHAEIKVRGAGDQRATPRSSTSARPTASSSTATGCRGPTLAEGTRIEIGSTRMLVHTPAGR